jgi:DNA polymerase
VITATVHPSSILRAPDDETQALEMQTFIADLRKVAERFSRSLSRTAQP